MWGKCELNLARQSLWCEYVTDCVSLPVSRITSHLRCRKSARCFDLLLSFSGSRGVCFNFSGVPSCGSCSAFVNPQQTSGHTEGGCRGPAMGDKLRAYGSHDLVSEVVCTPESALCWISGCVRISRHRGCCVSTWCLISTQTADVKNLQRSCAVQGRPMA